MLRLVCAYDGYDWNLNTCDGYNLYVATKSWLEYDHIALMGSPYSYVCEYIITSDQSSMKARHLTRILYTPPVMPNQTLLELGSLYTAESYTSIQASLPVAMFINDYAGHAALMSAAFCLQQTVPNSNGRYAESLINLKTIADNYSKQYKVPEIASQPAQQPSLAQAEVKPAVVPDVADTAEIARSSTTPEAAVVSKSTEDRAESPASIPTSPSSAASTAIGSTPASVLYSPPSPPALCKSPQETFHKLERKPVELIHAAVKPTPLATTDVAKPKLTWLYTAPANIKAAANKFRPEISISDTTKVHMQTGLIMALMSSLIFSIAEYGNYIDREELWNDPRSRITPNVINTAIVSLASCAVYLHVLNKNVAKQEDKSPASIEQRERKPNKKRRKR